MALWSNTLLFHDFGREQTESRANQVEWLERLDQGTFSKKFDHLIQELSRPIETPDELRAAVFSAEELRHLRKVFDSHCEGENEQSCTSQSTPNSRWLRLFVEEQ